MTIDLHKWTFADREALMALCNAVDRTYLSDRLPYPDTEADADWWLGMVTGNDGKEGVWRAIVVDGQVVGSISVERMANENRSVGSIGYMILTPFWSQGIGTEAVRQICGIAFRELALERIIGEVFPENLASARQPLVTHLTMKAAEDMLPADRFMRIHRSFIVNLSQIASVTPQADVKVGEALLHVSEGYRPAFDAYLSSLS